MNSIKTENLVVYNITRATVAALEPEVVGIVTRDFQVTVNEFYIDGRSCGL